MKRRLHQPALSQVQRAFARQQSLTENAPSALETTPLQKIALIRDEHIPHQMRVIEQKDVLPRRMHVRDVAVGAREAAKKRERIASGSVDDECSKRPGRSRRIRERRRHASNSSSAEETAL